MEYHHIPVMREQVLRVLDPVSGGLYVDCTLGGGGHAEAILERSAPDGLLIACDQDPDAIAHARSALERFGPRVTFFHANFADLASILHSAGHARVNGIVADLGVSFYQLSQSGRGFSFQTDEPLDMRMNPEASFPTAAQILNTFSQEALADIFFHLGEEVLARRIAARIVREREKEPIETASRLAGIVSAVYAKAGFGKRRIHPATKTFMALRIAVNSELENLSRFLADLPDCLVSGGRACIISFHSLEDRMVKQRFRELEKGCTCPADIPVCVCGKKPMGRVVTRRPLSADAMELEENPLSRSARLRVFERI